MISVPDTPGLPPEWARLLEDHARAIEEFRVVAAALDRTLWMAPIAPGKWSPAEVTAHVAEVYRVLGAELGGAEGMRLRGSRLQRLVLRYTILPRLLTGKPFPRGARAPREIRPTEIITDPVLAVTMLVNLAEQFTAALTQRATRPGVRLTHAYFGRLSPRQGLELSTVHTRHHAQQLTAIKRSPLPS
jgi:hypothetical protein